ncbi:MAG TPA: tRNA 2-thiouridine(34) synthase MnmA [Firmicutes bacterium]|nr:tRNA 2-thiouridine(34) synthase MnmA [Bacillota bacterium]
MSGGVDSSLAAALLVKQGYEVIGVTMQIWPAGETSTEAGEGCCSLGAVEDARRVASHLGIPFYVLNFREEFERDVIEYFICEYGRGRTPNPCIRCNNRIKFGLFLSRARELGAHYIATGHYARIRYDWVRERYILRKARDERKDQTYVLYGLTQEQLAATLMPLGDFTKETTRRLAREFGLKRVAGKPESQEICFIPDNDYREFLRRRSPDAARPGPIVDRDGRVLGTHRGIGFYTIGQRKGLGIAAGEPLYVIDIDPERNAVVVGRKPEALSQGLIAEDVNWVAVDGLSRPARAQVKIRHQARAVPATLHPAEVAGTAQGLQDRGPGRPGVLAPAVRVIFDEPQHAVTPGQSAVFYDGDIVLGGGIIRQNIDTFRHLSAGIS